MKLWFSLALLLGFTWKGQADKPVTDMRTLTNGLRVVSVYFPGSTNAAIFTYLCMGLAGDGPHQAQWSHLVEHLVIRSTAPADSESFNAETLPDHMRLDFYGSIGNWREGLSHHRRWLEGVAFTDANLQAEKPKVKQECDFTVQNFATHKFALAAWAQGFRHDQTNAALKGDIDRVTLAEIQKYRDERLVAPSNVVVCIVGGVQPATAFAVAEELQRIKSGARSEGPGDKVISTTHKGGTPNGEMTWDLAARHLVMSWPAPSLVNSDFPALLVAAEWLNMQFFSDPELKEWTGMTMAGADLTTPEGNYFYLSASLRPGGSFQKLQQKLEQQVRRLSAPAENLTMVPMIGQQLAEAMTSLPDLKSMAGQLPPSVEPAMAEMNLGLQWSMNEFRYGTHKPALANQLAKLKAQDIRQVAGKYLSDTNRSVVTLQPSRP